MIETVIAVLVVSFLFFMMFKFSHALSGKILLQHAAMRVARARAVGFNDFMCVKSARVAVIPVAGEQLWPTKESGYGGDEVERVRAYMETTDDARARGILEYEGWQHLSVMPGDGGMSIVTLKNEWFDTEGQAGIEKGYTYYLEAGE